MDDINEDPSIEQPPAEDNPELHRVQPSRRRPVVRQATFHENSLDNAVLNSQQQFEDMSDNSNSDDEDRDRLFEEYLRENNRADASSSHDADAFDTELPMNHSYLGNMDSISGLNYFEDDRIYEMPVCRHHSLIFPGEILPMIMTADSIFEPSQQTGEGLTFGLVFSDAESKKNDIYGVTCQVYEKGVDINGHITMKSRAHQRFKVIRNEDGHLTTSRNQKYFAKVKILPEIVLADPISSLNPSNNLKKYTQNITQYNSLRTFIAASSAWPKFVYDQYEIETVKQKVERYLGLLNVTAPSDPVLKSFWLARNIPLTSEERLEIFASNCVNKRMLMMGESLNFMCSFLCKRCNNKISMYNDIFPMSKGNLAGNYCNPAGYIHETISFYKVSENSIRMIDRPSTDFSWFPGYAWQIAVCSKCSTHVGWKFIAVSKNLKPRMFFGLSGKSLTINATTKSSLEDDEDEQHSEDNITEAEDD